jgi:shikimate kinase
MRTDSKKNNEDKQKRPRIVEFVGPAGAGKTTLCKLLNLSRGVRLSNFPDVRKVTNIPFFILHGLQLTPVLAHIFRFDDGRLRRREIAWLTILNGWHMVLQQELKKNNDIILLDQGPVYLLSEISGFGPDCLKEEGMEQIWRIWYRQWAAILDAVVWLDAADEDLLKRIQNREKEHIVKDESAQVIFAFLERYRNVYEHTLSRLTANRSDLKVFRFDTTRQTPQRVADQILAEFDLSVTAS